MRAARLLAPLAAVAALLTAGQATANVAVTRISADPFTNASSQHATQVEPDTFAHGKTILAAIQTGRFYDGGASDLAWALSKDGGATWTNGVLPGVTKYQGGGPYDRVSDPSVAYDASHHVWLIAGLALNETPGPVGVAVVVSHSSDGTHWSDPVVAGTGANVDKNWIVCDSTATSPYYGHCYLEWDDFGANNRIKMSTSTDGGLTWGAALNTANSASGLGGQPVVDRNGVVTVPIANAVVSAIISFSSTDGGATWSQTRSVSTVSMHTVAGGLRADALPSAEIDRKGRVYVVWSDCRFRANCTSNDIVMSVLRNGTWSAVTRIPIDSTASGVDHFIPGIAVDRTTGGAHAHLVLAYYSYPVANCGANCQLTVNAISSTDGGATWSAPTQLAGPMNLAWLADTSQGRMVGDYISASFIKGGVAIPVFALANAPAGAVFDEAMTTTSAAIVPRPGVRPASSAGAAAVTTQAASTRRAAR